MADRRGPAEPRQEWAQLPSEREVRRDRWLRQALILSLLVHAILVLLAVLVARRIPLPPILVQQPPRPIPPHVNVEFTDQRVEIPAVVQPETTVVGETAAEARSPGPEPPAPHGRTSIPDPELGLRGDPAPPVPDERPEPEAEAPAEEPRPTESSAAETIEEKKRRVAAALGRIGSYGEAGEGGEGELPGEPSSGIGFKWGGNAMQIESRSDVDWGPWAQRVQREVKGNWYAVMPVAARVGMKGIVVVRFRVQRDGTITDFEVMESAGVPPLDRAVNDALLVMSSPLPPLPLPEDSDEESIRITYTFVYNLDDDREMRAWRRMNWQRQRSGEGG